MKISSDKKLLKMKLKSLGVSKSSIKKYCSGAWVLPKQIQEKLKNE